MFWSILITRSFSKRRISSMYGGQFADFKLFLSLVAVGLSMDLGRSRLSIASD